jgi:hypothetical protein
MREIVQPLSSAAAVIDKRGRCFRTSNGGSQMQLGF